MAMSEKLMTDTETLERILESLPEGIVGHDRERQIIYFNRAAEEITGWPRDQIIGKDCHKAFGAPFCGKHCSFCEGTPDSQVDLTYPLNLVTMKGEPKQLMMSVSSITDGKGSIIGHTAVFRDVTDLVGLKVWEAGSDYPGIVGRDPKLVQIFKKIYELCNFDFPVLITGETGTGKELIAHAVHSESKRASGPFIPINCGALPEGLAESELFGHVKGAFSGAIRDKRGRFELAHGGTLFLDEVAELPKSIQVKILRVLENGTFERVGGEKTITVDVRVISATNRDLKVEMEKNNFREDLFYRLNAVPLYLPPLRERKNDIPLLVDHFLNQARNQGHRAAQFSKEARALLLAYDWPGNIRELRSVIQYALAGSKGNLIKPEDLPPELSVHKPQRQPGQRLDQETVQAVLAQCGGNKVKAARLLKIGRATLYRFLRGVS
jgi:sigma-54 dependent transcriptional regulator, acetoin dehydrogenase operon transcriptional activator AcoR